MLARFVIVVVFCVWGLQGVVRADTSVAAPGADAEITHRVVGKLAQVDGEIAQHVHVSTLNGIVTLEGRVFTSSQKIKLLSDAGSVAGVVKVQDRLSVRM